MRLGREQGLDHAGPCAVVVMACGDSGVDLEARVWHESGGLTGAGVAAFPDGCDLIVVAFQGMRVGRPIVFNPS